MRDPDTRSAANRRYYLAHKGADRARRMPGAQEEKKVLFTTRVPISLVARMQRLADEGLATGKYPWKSRADVHKALLLRGLETMAGDPLIDEMLQYLRTVQQIDGIAAHRREAQAAFSHLLTEITELNRIKATEQAAMYVQQVAHSVEEMSPNVWRDWLREKIRKAFPRLLTMKVRAITLSQTPMAVSVADRRKQHKRSR